MPRAWKALVRDGKRAVAQEQDAKWELGDLALEVEPMARSGVRTGSEQRLREYANAIGLELETLLRYRKVASAWPASRRRPAAISHTAHEELMGDDDRFRYAAKLAKREPPEGYGTWSVNAIRVDRGKQPRRNGAPGEPDAAEKAELVTEALGDWGVLMEIEADPAKRERLDEALDHVYEAAQSEGRAAGGPTVGDVIEDRPTPKERRRVEALSTLHVWASVYTRLLTLAQRMEEQGVERPAEIERLLAEVDYAENVLREFHAALAEHRSEARAAAR